LWGHWGQIVKSTGERYWHWVCVSPKVVPKRLKRLGTVGDKLPFDPTHAQKPAWIMVFINLATFLNC